MNNKKRPCISNFGVYFHKIMKYNKINQTITKDNSWQGKQEQKQYNKSHEDITTYN